MTKTECSIPATEVRIGDRPSNIAGCVTIIDRHEDGIVFGTTFGAVFARKFGENVMVSR